MAKTDKDSLQKFSELMKKAVQRGEKLERTLTKLVAQSEPGSAAENFLKAIQDGLNTIRKSGKAKKRPASVESKKSTREKVTKSAAKPEKRKAISRKPPSADISPLAEVDSRA